MTRERVAGLATAAVGPPAWCTALGGLLGGDPLLAVEIGAVTLGLLWTILTVRDAITSHRIARRLAADAREIDLFGVRCRVTSSIGADALVIGLIRPQIFVGQALLATLMWDELQAVVYHEDHHRRFLPRSGRPHSAPGFASSADQSVCAAWSWAGWPSSRRSPTPMPSAGGPVRAPWHGRSSRAS